MGPHGDETRKSVAEQRREAEQDVAQMVFDRMLYLKDLWVGNCSKATVSRTATGRIDEITWSYVYRQAINSRY